MNRPSVFIITGKRGEGKTSFITKLSELLIGKGLKVKGIISKGYLRDGCRTGFDLLDPETGMQFPLARLAGLTEIKNRDNHHGKFAFASFAIKEGTDIVLKAIKGNYDIIVLDEVGMAEIKGLVWAEVLEIVLRTYKGVLILAVRDQFVDLVKEHWSLAPVEIFDISVSTPESVSLKIESQLTSVN